jgi:hypothetical protein
MHTIHWKQHPFSDLMYNTFHALIPSILDPDTTFERTFWGCIIGGERGIYIERRPSLAYATTQVYLTDLLKVLVLMTEFGAATITHTGHRKEFLKALEDVHKLHPLMTYEQQKQSFNRASE